MSIRHRSWRAAYGPLLPGHEWPDPDPASPGRVAARLADGTMLALVAPAEGRVLAYSLYGPCRDAELPGADEVYAIYADPDHWSTGLGRVLFAATVDALTRRPVVLWVLEANERARRFYEAAGFVADGGRQAAEMPGGAELPEIRYRLD